MKKQICINVDMDSWIIAKQKIPNISAYLDECLKALSGKTDKEMKIEDIDIKVSEINNSIQELSIKKSLLEMDKKILKEEIEMKVREQKEAEQYQRWKCPVCQHINFMDVLRCNGCQLPTRSDAKTTIINIKEQSLNSGEKD